MLQYVQTIGQEANQDSYSVCRVREGDRGEEWPGQCVGNSPRAPDRRSVWLGGAACALRRVSAAIGGGADNDAAWAAVDAAHAGGR